MPNVGSASKTTMCVCMHYAVLSITFKVNMRMQRQGCPDPH